MLKEVVEENSQIRANLKVQTEQVYQLRRSQFAQSETQPSGS